MKVMYSKLSLYTILLGLYFRIYGTALCILTVSQLSTVLQVCWWQVIKLCQAYIMH